MSSSGVSINLFYFLNVCISPLLTRFSSYLQAVQMHSLVSGKYHNNEGKLLEKMKKFFVLSKLLTVSIAISIAELSSVLGLFIKCFNA